MPGTARAASRDERGRLRLGRTRRCCETPRPPSAPLQRAFSARTLVVDAQRHVDRRADAEVGRREDLLVQQENRTALLVLLLRRHRREQPEQRKLELHDQGETPHTCALGLRVEKKSSFTCLILSYSQQLLLVHPKIRYRWWYARRRLFIASVRRFRSCTKHELEGSRPNLCLSTLRPGRWAEGGPRGEPAHTPAASE